MTLLAVRWRAGEPLAARYTSRVVQQPRAVEDFPRPREVLCHLDADEEIFRTSWNDESDGVPTNVLINLRPPRRPVAVAGRCKYYPGEEGDHARRMLGIRHLERRASRDRPLPLGGRGLG
jgi:hypothetical protein